MPHIYWEQLLTCFSMMKASEESGFYRREKLFGIENLDNILNENKKQTNNYLLIQGGFKYSHHIKANGCQFNMLL